MPAADAILLPLCIGLSLIGVLVVALGWRRGNRGRILQGVGLALAPTGLYFSGLLSLLWNGAVATVGWASQILFTPAVWFGLSLVALCVVLWVVGGFLVRRDGRRAPAVSPRGKQAGLPAKAQTQPAQPARSGRSDRSRTQQAEPVDEDMAEIEAILKSRGIQ